MISGARAFIAALWLGGCTIPLEIGSNQPLPNWSGVPQDADGDGVGVAIDCDDTDPGVGGKPEICDGLDNDCDDVVDEDGVCAVTELFELHGNLDLLVVVDASDEAARVRERFLDVLPGILQPLFREEVTAQVAVGTGDG
ncbi:MAG: putative metal-binding motif-containing protein, partial [Myxococcota bacterium]